MMHDPIARIAEMIGPGGKCYFLPNGGNLGDSLIAAAAIQRLAAASIPWDFIRGRRREVRPVDVLAFGGGGSLVRHYEGGVGCVRSLLGLGAPVVVLPQSCSGHEAFWSSAGPVTVFCRDEPSLANMQAFPNVTALAAHDMAIGLDLSTAPFAAVRQFRERRAELGDARLLVADRRDEERLGEPRPGSIDVSAMCEQGFHDAASILGCAGAFLAMIAAHAEIRTDRLHVAIAGGLLGIPTELSDTRHGKNRAVYEASLRTRFPCVRFAER